jgi:RNA polymerase sigma factor (sigma-70 family)
MTWSGAMEANATSLERHRQQPWFGRVVPYWSLLRRFVRREIHYLENNGDLGLAELSTDDIADAVLLDVQRQFVHDPEPIGRAWLLRRAHEHIESELTHERQERGHLHLNESVSPPEGEPAEPATPLDQGFQTYLEPEYLTLEDLIPDINVSTPEQEAQWQETWTCISQVLSAMPAEARRALELYYIEGLTTAELAEALHHPTSATRHLLERARLNFQRRLAAAGCRFGER